MLVDRYQVKIPRIDSSATTINVPIDLTPQMVDQSEIVNREFVSVEVDNAAGFSDDDLRYRKNKLTKSFLQLSFYDSDIVTDQRLVASMSINPNITSTDIQPNSTLYPVADKQLEFRLRNPLTDDEAFGEGFFVYYFKDEVDINLPEFLYMRATFNNTLDTFYTEQ